MRANAQILCVSYDGLQLKSFQAKFVKPALGKQHLSARESEFRLSMGMKMAEMDVFNILPVQVLRRSSAISANSSSAACKSSTISAAITSGAGKLAASSRLSSLSQKMSRLALSRFTRSS